MRERLTKLQCPLCDAQFEAKPVSDVDAVADEEALSELISGDMNRVACEKCGHRGVLPEPIFVTTRDSVIAYLPVDVPANRKAALARRMNDQASQRAGGQKSVKSCFGPQQLRSELRDGQWPPDLPPYWRRFDDPGSPHHRRRILSRLVRSGEADLTARIQLGISCYELADYSSARTFLQGVLHEEPGNLDALRGLASVELDDGHPERALQYYDKVVSITHDPLAHFLAGVAAFQSGQHGAARERFEAAISGNDRYVDAYVWLARAHIALEHRPQALNALRRAAEAGLKDPDVILQYPDLRTLEADGAFKAIISAIRKQHARARQKTRGADRSVYDRPRRRPARKNRRKTR